jgi:hypothetical protein
MGSFIAAGTAYATHGVNMIPFFIFYSMFGFQRIGDLIWASPATARPRLPLGATAGRTTLAGEGLQHQDGHSHVLACHVVPNLRRLRPGLRLRARRDRPDGIRRMYGSARTSSTTSPSMNENYPSRHARGRREGILRGSTACAAPRKGKAGRGPSSRQRRDPARGAARAGDPRRALRRRRRRLERHQLQGAPPRRPRGERWNLLHPARGAAKALRHPGARGHAARSSRPPTT